LGRAALPPQSDKKKVTVLLSIRVPRRREHAHSHTEHVHSHAELEKCFAPLMRHGVWIHIVG
jgi:hypothetical protein